MKKIFLIFALIIVLLAMVQSMEMKAADLICWDKCVFPYGWPMCQAGYVGYHNCATPNQFYCVFWPEGDLCMVY